MRLCTAFWLLAILCLPGFGAPPRLLGGERPLPLYTLEERIGQTGTTEVWRAVRDDGSKLALKFVAVGGENSRAVRETRTMVALRDVRVGGLLVADTAWAVENYLVFPMALAEDTLAQMQERAMGPLPLEKLLPVMETVAATLDAMTEVRRWRGRRVRGLVHRDVKPENIFFVNGDVVLGDVEWTVPLSAFATRGEAPAGTPGYAAPEFFHGETTIRSDQFSLAATYVAMRLGRFPFPSAPLKFEGGWKPGEPMLHGLGREEQEVLKRALSADPTRRFESCGAFIAALGEAADR